MSSSTRRFVHTVTAGPQANLCRPEVTFSGARAPSPLHFRALTRSAPAWAERGDARRPFGRPRPGELQTLAAKSSSDFSGASGFHSDPRRRRLVYPSASSSVSFNGGESLLGDEDHKDMSSSPNGQLNKFRALVLDVSYRPIDTVPWSRAVVLDFFDKVDVLEYYDSFVRSSRDLHYLPAVVRVRFYVKKIKGALEGVPLTRRNVYARDSFECQYCGSDRQLTLDHIKPISRGGGTTWTNIVTACSRCNQMKGDKPLKQTSMKLKKPPKEPSPYEMSAYMIANKAQYAPEEWKDYLPPGCGEWIFGQQERKEQERQRRAKGREA